MGKLANKEAGRPSFIEILGDTISGKQLIVSIILSIAVSLGGYKSGQWLFPKIADAQMVDSYSLLLGITGTVLVLGVNSFLFRPKRLLVEDNASPQNMIDVLEELDLDVAEELRLIEEDPATVRELKEMGVWTGKQTGGEETK